MVINDTGFKRKLGSSARNLQSTDTSILDRGIMQIKILISDDVHKKSMSRKIQ